MDVDSGVLIARCVLQGALLTVALYWASGLSKDRLVRLLTMSSFVLRVAIGQALFLISTLHLPIAATQQIGGGFWAFALDAKGYDEEARQVMQFLLRRGSLPNIVHGFAWFPGVVYTVFGATPSSMLLLNAAMSAAVIPLVWSIALHVGKQRSSALLAAAAVGFWPSSFAWSSQLLKDPLQWLCLFIVLASLSVLLSSLLGNPVDRQKYRLATFGFLAGGLILAAIRGDYETPMLALVTIAALALTVIQRALRGGAIPFRSVSGVLLLMFAGAVPTMVPSVRAKLAPYFAPPPPKLVVSTEAAATGDSVTVSWTGDRNAGPRDQIGLFPQRGVDSSLISWEFLSCSQVPGYFAESGSCPFTLPPDSGVYEFRLRLNSDGDVIAISAPVVVGAPAKPALPSIAVATPSPLISTVLRAVAESNEQPTEPAAVAPDASPHPAGSGVEPSGQGVRNAARGCPVLGRLVSARAGFVGSGGGSQIDPDLEFRGCTDVLAYMPRAWELTFLAPLPTDWLQPGSTVGSIRFAASIDAVLQWVLLPGLLVGAALVLKHPSGIGVALLIYVAILSFALGFAVSNFGTLFRLRLQVILPACIVAAHGSVQLAQMCAHFFQQRHLSIAVRGIEDLAR